LRRFAATALFLAALSPWPVAAQGKVESAVFAAGCFWCVEEAFDKVEGVVETISGYSGGKVPNPTYEQVSRGGTGHTEVVEVRYDPAKVDYRKLLDTFWKNVDPVDAGGQFCDRGDSYRSAIFVGSEEERRLAEETKREVAKTLGQPVATEIVPEAPFYAAEGYHQNYYQTNPLPYRYYKWRCGREARLEALRGQKGS
jgi:peptide-methionine (S)-S-oxide reductase